MQVVMRFLSWALFFNAASAFATVLPDVTKNAPSGSSIQGVLAFTDTDYQVTDTSKRASIDRTLLCFQYDHSLAKTFNLMAFGGVGIDETYGDADGQGFAIGFGLRKLFLTKERVQIFGAMALTYLDEWFKNNGIKTSTATTDFMLGPAVRVYMDKHFSLIGAADIFPLSKGRGRISTDSGSSGFDFERDDRVTLRMGVKYSLSHIDFRAEAAFVGEHSFILGLGQSL